MIAIDIETGVDDLEENQRNWFAGKNRNKRLVDPKKIDEDIEKSIEKFPLNPLTGKIILIGLVSDTQFNSFSFQADGFYYKQIGILKGEQEKDSLIDFWNIISNAIAGGHRVVTFNGKKFDFPFIFARSLYYGLTKPNIMRGYDALISKYNNVAHVDLFNILGDENKQSEWANKFIPNEPLSSDGHLIPKWYENGDYEAILNKNFYDLRCVFYLYKKIESWI